MTIKDFDSGIRLEFDESALSANSAPSPSAIRGATMRGGGRFATGPHRIQAAGEGSGANRARDIADRLKDKDVVSRTSKTIEIGPARATSKNRGDVRVPSQPTKLTVELDPGEEAVVLIEGDGVLAWRFGREVSISVLGANQRRGKSKAARVLEFDLGVPPIDASAGVKTAGAKRGFLKDRLIEGVKAIVLYFAAKVATDTIVDLLERKKRDGPVVIASATDVGKWLQPDSFKDVVLPQDRTPRILLFVHGTFSSTVGGFGEFTVTPWGQRLLTAARQRYDAVLAFDHRTLALDPRENAKALLSALATLGTTQPLEIDAVCHSRGGLVLRALIEELLPQQKVKATVKRAIFVAATNHGTELAKPKNWETLVDLVTNLSSMSSHVLSLFPATAAAAQIVDEVISTLGEFVKYLVQVAVDDRRAPGLAAMNPSGDFVAELNKTQTGQPKPGEIDYYAVTSDFYAKFVDGGEHEPKEMPKRLAFILANGVVDRLMRGDANKPVPNDLVVDVASMTDIDSAVGGYVKDVLDFGHNTLVYHTNYFVRPETVGRIAQWLKLPSPVDDIAPEQLAGGSGLDVLPVPATASVEQVRKLVRAEKPGYLVFKRKHALDHPREWLNYAVKPTEFLEHTKNASGHDSVIDAFHLNEGDRSVSFEKTHVQTQRPVGLEGARPHTKRSVIVSGEQVIDVLEPGSSSLDATALATLAHKLTGSKPASQGGALKTTAKRKGGGDAFRSPAKTVKKKPPPKVDVFAGAEMPREATVGQRVMVSVSLSAEHITPTPGTAHDQKEFTTRYDSRINVHIVARRGYDYATDDVDEVRAEVKPPSPGSPVLLDFSLVAKEAGKGEVLVLISEGPRRILTLTLHSTVSAGGRGARTLASASGTIVEQPGDKKPCPIFTIIDRRNEGQLQFEYILQVGGADGVNDRFRSAGLRVDPVKYVEQRYKAIEDAWTGSKRSIAMFATKLEAAGGAMFRELFPDALQAALWKLMKANALDNVLVYSEEPFLPWEMVFLDDPSEGRSTGQGKFFAEVGLCRWMYGVTPTLSIRVRKTHRRHVIPHYPDPNRLEAAETIEEPMLKKMGSKPIKPMHAEVLAALRQPGSFDMLHFACHGQAEAEHIEDSELLLQGEIIEQEDGTYLSNETLSASTVSQFANLRAADGNRPLVVVNACQTGRVAYTLTGAGGFAPAFLGAREGTGDSRGRAGAFVGALWSVDDTMASTFVSNLYQQLKRGANIAEASRQARNVARKTEATWLAYAIYAHPHLTVTFDS